MSDCTVLNCMCVRGLCLALVPTNWMLGFSKKRKTLILMNLNSKVYSNYTLVKCNYTKCCVNTLNEAGNV